MKAVFLDRGTLDCGRLDFAPLEHLGLIWDYYDHTRPAEVARRIAGYPVVLTNKVAVVRAVIEQAVDLKLLCLAATGTNNVDLASARESGVVVCNVRDYATPSVVQLVFTLILALYSRLAEHSQAVSLGAWSRSPRFCILEYPFHELHGKTLGVIGYGTLGQGVAQVARAFGMRVAVAQRPGKPGIDVGRIPLTQLLAEVDIVSLHCPLADNTRGLINAKALSGMKPSALLINTARGGLIDEGALLEALTQGRLGGAGLDVLSVEPPPQDHPLLHYTGSNLILTPHVAWASLESRQRMVYELAANIRAFMAGTPRNVVTLQ